MGRRGEHSDTHKAGLINKPWSYSVMHTQWIHMCWVIGGNGTASDIESSAGNIIGMPPKGE